MTIIANGSECILTSKLKTSLKNYSICIQLFDRNWYYLVLFTRVFEQALCTRWEQSGKSPGLSILCTSSATYCTDKQKGRNIKTWTWKQQWKCKVYHRHNLISFILKSYRRKSKSVLPYDTLLSLPLFFASYGHGYFSI